MTSHSLAQTRDLIHILVQKELKLRYRGTHFGVLWSLANPLAFAFVLHLAFRRILQIDIDNYALFILSTLFPWQWFTNSMTEGATTFVVNSALVKKLPFPKIAVPIAVVLGGLAHFLITIPLLAALVLFSGKSLPLLTWSIGIPLLALVQMVHTTALVAAIACVNAFLRDTGQLLAVALLLLFYLTPIVYPQEMVPVDLHWLFFANPIAPLMVSWRDLIANGVISEYHLWAAAQAAIAVAVCTPLYRHFSWRVPEVV